MEGSISPAQARHRAERLRRLRPLVDTMPPGPERDEVRAELEASARDLASSRLTAG